MIQPVLLVAGSGLARETAQAIAGGATYQVRGVLDDNPELWGTTLGNLPVLGGIDAVLDHPDHQIVLCAGKGAARIALAARLAALGVVTERFATVVHPRATVPESTRIGAGSIILAGVVVTDAVELGRHVVVMPNSVLTHDNWLGDGVTICAGVCLAGFVRVEDRGYVGAAASVRERVRIGAGSVVGMGSAVLNDVPAGETWAGNPARPLRRATAPAALLREPVDVPR